MRSKFSSLVLASAALAAVALTALPAVATTSTTLNVPFSFTVDGQSLPAGMYSVVRDSTGTFVRLQGKDASQRFTWLARPGATHSDRVILKFEGQGKTHVLQSVQFGPLITDSLDQKTRSTEDMTPQAMPGF
jgi:hypothetical protein